MSVKYRMARKFRKAHKRGEDEDFQGWFQRSLKKENLYANPYAEIIVRPTYYGLEGDIRDFYIAILEGYMWEAENSDHFIAVHAEMEQVKRVLGRLVLHRDRDGNENGRFWPNDEADLQLTFIDFARLIPYLWD